jgi:2-iminobutanoate/2-iminopropanoate deaminase
VRNRRQGAQLWSRSVTKGPMPTKRSIIASKDAPEAIGPYSQAVAAGRFVFCSGQIALDPATGQMVGGGDVAAQTRQVLDNLEAVLHEGGAGFHSVVKTTIYLRNMDDFARVNEVYGERFGADPPARATVEVSRLPKDALVEIDAVALIPLDDD